METFQNGAIGLVALSHVHKECRQEKEPAPIHHQLMEQTAQEVTTNRLSVKKDHAQVL